MKRLSFSFSYKTSVLSCGIMESLMCLKKSSPIIDNYNLCIFCQKRQVNDDVREGGEKGIATVRTATNSRKEFGSIDVLDRVDEAIGKSNVKILWHRTYYAQYTDKNKIECLRKSNQGRSTRSANWKSSNVDDKKKKQVV